MLLLNTGKLVLNGKGKVITFIIHTYTCSSLLLWLGHTYGYGRSYPWLSMYVVACSRPYLTFVTTVIYLVLRVNTFN